MDQDLNTVAVPFFLKPVVGKTLGLLAAISFYFLCMLFPLIGPAGSKMTFAKKNEITFIAVLMLTFTLALSTVFLKIKTRKQEGGPFPIATSILSLLCLIILVILKLGGFAI